MNVLVLLIANTYLFGGRRYGLAFICEVVTDNYEKYLLMI